MFACVPALLATSALGCDWTTARSATPMRLAQNQDTARPARGPQQTTVATDQAPPATASNTTAATDQNPTVKQMNQEAAGKTSKEGK
jgi:hypothetical protein